MNVKKGDMAIIVGGVEENLGKIVEVVDFFGDDRGVKNCWLVKCASDLIGYNGLGIKSKDKKAIAADVFLKPISGLKDTDDENTDVDLGVGVMS